MASDRAFAFEHAVHATIAEHAAIAGGDRVLVAVSGGADSTALLAALEALRRRGELAIALAVAHLNHGLRGAESERDQAAVEALATCFALPCFVGRSSDLSAATGNREGRARTARFAFLRDAARGWNASKIAVAHTRDDQAETVLLRLARGGGPASLAAMAVVRRDGVIRPLLERSRAEGVEYLGARGLAWVEDGSNADQSFFRNRVRRRLLPLLEAELGVDVRQRLARLASELGQESALAEQRLDALLARSADGTLALETVREAGVAAPRLVHAWLARQGVRASERQIDGLLRLLRGGKPSSTMDLGAGRQVRRCYERLLVEERPAPATFAPDAELAIPGVARIPGWEVASVVAGPARAAGASATADEVALDAAQLAAPLALRPPRAGDRVELVYGRRKLADILIDARVPRQERMRLAVISSGSDVLWVPGVVRSVVAKPSPTTHVVTTLHAVRVGVE